MSCICGLVTSHERDGASRPCRQSAVWWRKAKIDMSLPVAARTRCACWTSWVKPDFRRATGLRQGSRGVSLPSVVVTVAAAIGDISLAGAIWDRPHPPTVHGSVAA
jgi:hypothetical protein